MINISTVVGSWSTIAGFKHVGLSESLYQCPSSSAVWDFEVLKLGWDVNPKKPRWSGQFFHGKARVWTPSKAQEASKRAENKHHPLHSGLVDKMANRGSSSLREESSCKWQNVPKVSSFYVKLHCVISIITINKMNTIMWVLALCWALCQKFPLNHSEILMGAGAG